MIYKDQSEQTAIVTGAGRGIGRAIAFEFADWGYDIVLTDLNSDEMDETRRIIEQRGVMGLCLRTDLRTAEDIDETVDRGLDTFGSVEALVQQRRYRGPDRDV